MLKINTDASTHPKHKISVGCFIIKHDDETIIDTFPLKAQDNHSAEFQTLLKALEYCIIHHLQDNLVFIYSDSHIVVNSIRKKYVKNEQFTPLLEAILRLCEQFPSLFIEWIPESDNKMADHYAKQTLQKELKKENRTK